MLGPPRWVERYLGIPGIDEGNTFKGCHCFGLMQLVFGRERGIALPTFSGIAAADGHDAVEAINRALVADVWTEVSGEMADFDGVLMLTPHRKIGLVPAHIGIAAGPRHVLHVRPGGVALCETVDRLKSLIVGIYRYQRA